MGIAGPVERGVPVACGTVLVDADGTVTDFGLDRIEAAGWPVGGFVLRPFPGPLYLYGTDRLRRCRLPDDTALGSWRAGDAEAAWLGRQLVVRHGADDTLRAIDRSDCRIVATEPVGDDVMVGMVAAPGVLAVLVVDDRGGVFVQGYRP